ARCPTSPDRWHAAAPARAPGRMLQWLRRGAGPARSSRVAGSLEGGQGLLCESEHALDGHLGAAADLGIDENLVAAFALEGGQQVMQPVHRHPGAMGAALAGGALAGRGRLDEL